MLSSLLAEGVDFLVVGAYAMAVHGVPRATGDIDIWVRPEAENAAKTWKALASFGAPLDAMSLRPEDLMKAGVVYQIGVAPKRIDVLTRISGVDFETAWQRRSVHFVSDLEVPFLGRQDLLANKKASGRPKDLVDVATLERA